MRGAAIGSGIPFRGAVKALIIINVAIWLILQVVVGKLILGNMGIITQYLGLIPGLVIGKGFIWQVFSYQFLHSLDPFHILFNMLILWWFGAELEQRWGTRFFVKYYLACGFGAGAIYVVGYAVWAMITGNITHLVSPVVGASGAVFGLLMAYGILFGERTIYFMMMFPLKAKQFIWIIAGIEVLYMITGVQSGVANLAHLGGFATGFVILSYIARKKQKNRGPKSNKRGGPQLKLVVDNDKADDDGPKYWN